MISIAYKLSTDEVYENKRSMSAITGNAINQVMRPFVLQFLGVTV